MLYDPKWEVKIDLHSLANLIAWLEKQKASQIYHFVDPDNCLLAQYLQHHGVEEYRLGCSEADAFFGTQDGNGHCSILRGFPRTFGAALKRARAELRTGLKPL